MSHRVVGAMDRDAPRVLAATRALGKCKCGFVKALMVAILVTAVTMGCVSGASAPPPPAVSPVEAPPEATTRTDPTPAPTPTPTAPTQDVATCPWAEELAYMASMERTAGDLILLLNEFAHLNELAVSDVSLIADDDWARKVDAVLVLMTIHAGEVLALDVPTTMRSIHSSFANMVSEIHAFAARYADGIDHADVVTIQGVLLHVAEADRWSREARQQMEALCREDKVGTSG